MQKTFTVALLALALSVGWAQAGTMHHKHVIPGCKPGAAAAKCACGTASGKPLICKPGQWCHPDHACTA